MNAWARLALGLALWVGLFAQAATLEVLSADRLELRREEGAELVILVGNPVEMRLDDQVLRAERVEYSRAARRLVLMGSVFLQDEEGRVIQGEYLELYLEDETLEALKVEVQAGEFDFTGPVAQRVAGQILLQEGYRGIASSPTMRGCSRGTRRSCSSRSSCCTFPSAARASRWGWTRRTASRSLQTSRT